MSNARNRYVDTIYNVSKTPITTYPIKFTTYICNRFKLKKNNSLLDIGCGRGDFTKGFVINGLKTSAVDQSDICSKYCPEAELKTSDLEKEGIPYKDNSFDIVYSKSVIEHFYNPEILAKEMYRVLKPGGLAITLCPAWEYNYKIYFEDYTHRTPFMLKSLRDIHIIHGFEDVKVEYFRQLPFLWKYPYLVFLSELTRIFIPDNFYKCESSTKFNKWIRFSKEIMLLSTAIKPKSNQ